MTAACEPGHKMVSGNNVKGGANFECKATVADSTTGSNLMGATLYLEGQQQQSAYNVFQKLPGCIPGTPHVSLFTLMPQNWHCFLA